MIRVVRTFLTSVAVALFVGTALVAPPVSAAVPQDVTAAVIVTPANCNIKLAWDATANQYIAKCRRAGIRREFPSQYLDVRVGEIYRSAQGGNRTAKKAWKLLNDNRWKKYRG